MEWTEKYYQMELEKLAEARNIEHAEFLKVLHEDGAIADNMRDYWKNQQGGSADWRG